MSPNNNIVCWVYILIANQIRLWNSVDLCNLIILVLNCLFWNVIYKEKKKFYWLFIDGVPCILIQCTFFLAVDNLNPICWADQCFGFSESRVLWKGSSWEDDANKQIWCMFWFGSLCACVKSDLVSVFEYVISQIIKYSIDVPYAQLIQYVKILYDCSLICVFDLSFVPVMLKVITVLLMYCWIQIQCFLMFNSYYVYLLS